MKSLQLALSSKGKKAVWGAVSIPLVIASLASIKPANACPTNPMIGGMCAFAGNFSIRNWAFANGALLNISSNTALFALLGTTYGGDGRSTFALPDLRGRAAVGVGNGPGLVNIALGQKRGVEFVSLTVAQIPQHNHSASTSINISVADSDISVSSNLNAHGSPGTSSSPENAVLAQNGGSFVYSTSAPDVALATDAISASANATVNATATTTLSNAGSGDSHDNRMPYLAVNWLIALQGIFPSRN